MAILKERKVVVIGVGAVGSSFLYAAANRSLVQRYEVIDISADLVEGTVLDIEDAIATSNQSFEIVAGSYANCIDADIIVITAGRPQRSGETRLDMIADNSKIMANIAKKIKASGFEGITIIASNPVDVMTQVYQVATGFDHKKVIGSGTSLDSARLKFEIAKRLHITPLSVEAYVLGEHGDSSVSVLSSATVGSKTLTRLVEEKLIDASEFAGISEAVRQKAYKIIKLKRATFYGIGSALANLVGIVLSNERKITPVGAMLKGEYGQKDIYVGVPCILGSAGIIKVIEIEMNKAEKTQFDKSCDQLRVALKTALAAIK